MSNTRKGWSQLWYEVRETIAWEIIDFAVTVMPGESKIELALILHPLTQLNLQRMKEALCQTKQS